MRLGDVLNKIFRKKKSDELVIRNKKPAEDIYKPIEHQIEDDSRFKKISDHINAEQGNLQTTAKERFNKKNTFILIGASIAAFLIVIALFGLMYVRISNSAFKESKVNIFIDGPETVSIGREIEYVVTVENGNRVKLNNAIIGLNFPGNFELKKSAFIVDKNLSGARIEVGEIKSKSKKQYKIKALIGYSNDGKSSLKTFVRYEPNNVSSSFQSSAVKNVDIVKSDISVLLFSAESISSGEFIDLSVVVKNNGQQEYGQLILKVEYPEDFNFDSSTEKPIDKNNDMWVLQGLRSGTQKEIKILGRLTGRINAVKKFKVTVLKESNGEGIIVSGEKNINIIPTKIILRQENNTQDVYPGAFVNYTIYFKNNSTVVLRDLILQAHLPGKYIKRSTVEHQKGYYDSRSNIIKWKAADVEKLKNLQPGEEGKIDFSMQIQDEILPEGNKNPYIRVYSEIESLDVDSPIFENKKVIAQQVKTLINSIMNVTSIVEYLPEDNNGEDRASLQVDQKTFLRVKFDMKNTTNDLKNVKLKAGFPSGIFWEKQVYPEGDNLEFHNRSNQMEWKMGAVSAGTGFVSPSEKAEFIISVTPSMNQSGREIDLISDMQIQAEDVFTGNNLEYKFQVIKSGAIEGLQDSSVAP